MNLGQALSEVRLKDQKSDFRRSSSVREVRDREVATWGANDPGEYH